MNIYAFGPIAAALDAAYAVLQFLITLLAPLAGVHSAALAIVVLTIVVRLALIPVGISQARAQRTRTRLAPRIAELRKRHAKNRERLQRETMALYAEEKASPFAGCLPLLIQAPILSLVYGLFLLPTINGHPNTLLDATLGGAPLGTSFVTALTSGTDPQGVVVSAIVLVLIAAIAVVSRQRSVGLARVAAASAGAGSGAGSGSGGTSGTAGGAAALPAGLPAAFGADGSATRILSWLPLITVVFAAFVPLAASLYLLVTTAWTLGERTILARFIH